MTHPLMRAIPDRLLERRGAQHARALIQWCAGHNFRPTLADIEHERRRRNERTDP